MKMDSVVRTKIYLCFMLILLVLVLGYTGTVLHIADWSSLTLWVSSIFIVLVLLAGWALIWILKYRIASVISTLDDVIESAVTGGTRLTGYQETIISSLENKLVRQLDLFASHDRKAQEEKNMIKALIADISHQTKTPLSNIVLYSQLLAEISGLPHDAKDMVTQIKSQSDKLNWLIQSLVKMSRLESGIISIQTTVNPVIDSITRAVSQLYALAQDKDITISIACDENIKARHDTKWSSEALFNLIENAVKYSDAGGRIEIAAQEYEMFVRIAISDTGIGIEDSEQQHIFQRFYRCKSAVEYDGVGIGLFLVREIISLQGGYVTVTSRVGEGSTFYVYLLRS
jgi:signal transduction histidine kinase